MRKPETVVSGCSGNAREALEMIEVGDRITALRDDATALQGTRFEGIPIEPFAALQHHPEAQVIVMIGSERSFRRRGPLIASLGVAPERWASLVHPAAQVWRRARLGRGR